MKSTKISLSAPWETFYHEIEQLFAYDNDVKIAIEDGDENKTVTLYVSGKRKYEALTELLQMEKTFGNITVAINVVPANKENYDSEDILNLYKDAFEGNDAVADILCKGFPGSSAIYVMFQKDVAQFYNDDVSDPRGIKSMLYADLAKAVLSDRAGVFFSTTTARYNNTHYQYRGKEF